MSTDKKITKRMQKSIDAVKAHLSYGFGLNLEFFVDDVCGNDVGYYDCCEIRYDTGHLKGINFSPIFVYHNGHVYSSSLGYFSNSKELVSYILRKK